MGSKTKRFMKRKLGEKDEDDHVVKRRNSADSDFEERCCGQREREELEQNRRNKEAAATRKLTKKLTEAEKRQLSYKRQILELTSEQISELLRRSSGLDEAENGPESEGERLRDQPEREQDKNLRRRDEAVTRKLTTKNSRQKEEEEAVRKTSADIEGLRRDSRQEYLKKRERKKTDEVRDDVEDEGSLFDEAKLSEADCRELRMKKQLLELVML